MSDMRKREHEELVRAAEEMKWRVREADPAFRYRITVTQVKQLRASQRKLEWVGDAKLHEAFECAVQRLKSTLHELIDAL